MYKVMLDTNVLIGFFLVYKKENKEIHVIPKQLKKHQILLRLFESHTFDNVMTSWNRWELREQIRDIWLQQKYISEGYTTREFTDAKQTILLSDEDLNLINQAVFDLWKFSIRENHEFSKKDIKIIENLTKKGYDFTDLLLIIQAKSFKCEFFITQDKKLKELSKTFNLSIVSINEFLSKIQK